MIISFNGDEGSGKSTIAQKVADELNCPRYYMGQIFRDMAKKRGLTLVEYLELGEQDPSVDKEVDDHLLQLAKNETDFVIESRTAWHLIPQSLKIYLKVDEDEGARRIFLELQNKAAQEARNEVTKVETQEEIKERLKRRRETDDKRYKKYYGIDIRKEENYDWVVDTTNLTIEQVLQKVLAFVKDNIASESK